MPRFINCASLPQIDYGNDLSFQFPHLSNKLVTLPDSFNRWGTLPDSPVHGFVDDWRLEAIWREQDKMVDKVIIGRFAIAPDFTVNANDPLPHAYYQVWRSRVVAAWWQAHGVYVVPVLQWSRPEINCQLFDGLQACQVVAVRSPSKGYEAPWRESAAQFLRVCRPLLVLHFGTKSQIDIWPNAVNMRLKPVPDRSILVA